MSFELPDPPRDEDAATRSPETSGRDASSAAQIQRDYPRRLKRLILAWKFREWPWRIPAQVVHTVGMRRPPEHVFEAFRRLHGIE